MSYNASLRAIRLRYSNVRWYRGGIEAWKAARLPAQPTNRGGVQPPQPYPEARSRNQPVGPEFLQFRASPSLASDKVLDTLRSVSFRMNYIGL